MKRLNLKTTIEINRETGEVIAVYFYIRQGKSARTREYADGRAFADYNSRGELLGIELLAPCQISVLDKIAAKEAEPVKRLLHKSIPVEMSLAG